MKKIISGTTTSLMNKYKKIQIHTSVLHLELILLDSKYVFGQEDRKKKQCGR